MKIHFIFPVLVSGFSSIAAIGSFYFFSQDDLFHGLSLLIAALFFLGSIYWHTETVYYYGQRDSAREIQKMSLDRANELNKQTISVLKQSKGIQ